MNYRKVFSEITTTLASRTLALFGFEQVAVYPPSKTNTEVITFWDYSGHTP